VNPHTKSKIETARAEVLGGNQRDRTRAWQACRRLSIVRNRSSIAGVGHQGASRSEKAHQSGVKSVFDSAETWRARRIAQTEGPRGAVSRPRPDEAAIQSGQWSAGWEMACSSADACPLCQNDRPAGPSFVPLGQAFRRCCGQQTPITRRSGSRRAHPHCNCTTLEVFEAA